MKVALLSNVTVSVLKTLLSETVDVWVPPGFGALVETALSPPEEMYAFSPDIIFLLIDRKFAGAPSLGDEESSLKSLCECFPGTPVVVPDISALAEEIGESFYDERMWTLASIPWSFSGMKEIAKLIAPLKKAVAVDLDETLWKGIAGEGKVVARKEFQEQLLRLKKKGVLLVALSKNNEEDLAGAWNSEGMVLSPDDFVAKKINWQKKSDNLLSVAEELGIGVEAFVFIDDNPAERAEMRACLSDVAVSPFPPDIDTFFPSAGRGVMGEERSAFYQAERRRRETAAGKNLDDYLQSLEMRLEIRELSEEDVSRVSELSQRSNQFNLTTNRYSEEEVLAFLHDPSHFIAVLKVADRFGDLGLVAFVHASGSHIVDFVMSCRAMNRKLEFQIESFVEKELKKRGVSCITSLWRRTAKNAPVKDIYERMGFTLLSESEEEKYYERILG